MARKWHGFLAQNQEIMEQWGILEESRGKIEARLQAILGNEDSSEEEDDSTIYVVAE